MAVQRPLVSLNGWTAARLDDLARDVESIREQIEGMRAEELAELKAEVAEARRRPRDQITAYLAPLLAGLIPTIVILIHG